MKLYAQQGYGTGDRINKGLSEGYIDGAILSPKDCRLPKLKSHLTHLLENFPNADRLVDPQYYATMIALEDANLGHLSEEDYPYFQTRRRGQLEPEQEILKDLRNNLVHQKELEVSAIIAPNIAIRRSLNSIEAVIAKNFIRHTASVWAELGDSRPVYATLAVDAEALQDKQELTNFLTDITLLENPPTGFYVLVNEPTTEITPELIDHRTLAGWMLLNQSLSLNGFEVINGYSDMVSPFLAAAGATAVATGWWSNLKVFSLSRFQLNSGGGRRPVPRYLSQRLLNSLRYDELDRTRANYPELLNGLPTDSYYIAEDGSQPNSQDEEILQTWNTLRQYWVTRSPEPSDCMEWIASAESLYSRLKSSPGIILPGRSNSYHLESLKDGVCLYAELAEIQL